MVLNMIDYCRNNAIGYIGYSYSFVITELSGIKHKRIVIRDVIYHGTDYRRNIIIVYDIHLINNHPHDSITSHRLEIYEDEYNELIEMTPFL